jgi:hypothetical protein
LAEHHFTARMQRNDSRLTGRIQLPDTPQWATPRSSCTGRVLSRYTKHSSTAADPVGPSDLSLGSSINIWFKTVFMPSGTHHPAEEQPESTLRSTLVILYQGAHGVIPIRGHSPQPEPVKRLSGREPRTTVGSSEFFAFQTS